MYVYLKWCLSKYFITSYFIHQEVEKIRVGARYHLLTIDTVIQLLQEECDDYDAIQSIDSESDISDDTSDFKDCKQNSGS